MRDVLAQKKVSPALRRCIQITGLILRIKEPELTDETLRSYLLDRPDEVLALVSSLQPNDVSELIHEQLCYLMDEADYDADVAARESESGLFLALHAKLSELRTAMVQAHQMNRCLIPSTKFMVGVDGSRQSNVAFETAVRLRRQGFLIIVNVDEELATSRQLPQISSELIIEEYKTQCTRLKFPANCVKISCEKSDAKTSVAQQLLLIAMREQVDFLVVGAYGKGGPAIDQVHHVPWDVLRCATFIPTIIVPLAPVTSVISKRYLFVLAVDKSAAAARCLNATLKLMRPADTLRIVHLYEEPIVGEYDTNSFKWYKDCIAEAKIDGLMVIQPVKHTSTIAEGLQDYLIMHGAAYLVLGKNGEGAEKESQSNDNRGCADKEPIYGKENHSSRIGRLASAMLFSPRCALCLCP